MIGDLILKNNLVNDGRKRIGVKERRSNNVFGELTRRGRQETLDFVQ